MNSREAALQLLYDIREAEIRQLQRQVRSLQGSVAALGALIFFTNMLILVQLVMR